ncbi:phosphate ABC transporter permease subunit PstC [Pyrobaculum sp. 3827-6]|uniref:phosphate ABC transporter permease subunit PstC n=1 Tax=Pyrobaculum sp. 3827-6 TaxID=2983604 RepID=UPI0021D9C00B|nr:phosphate ABC transporter permease subunit PstC [Pyrobaculum sp. 3827-6]MCU7788887.1 phosphate ABC transporter permease subunit PstC [Pyrobaculum sp. 3827-6]
MLGLLLLLFLGFYAVSAAALIFLKFRWGMRVVGLAAVLILGSIAVMFAVYSAPALAKYGLSLFTTAEWDPGAERYGLLSAIVGTLISSAIAITVAMPLAVSAAVAINEFLPSRVRWVVASLLDLTAAMPTVIYGLWGRDVLGPALAAGLNALGRWLLGVEPVRAPLNLLTAGVLLAVMITPYAAAIIREGYVLIPRQIEEAIYAVGATRFEAVLIKLRYIKQYVAGGFFLALGRAMGETAAVAMVVGGNYVRLVLNPVDPGITISSLIALQFPNAANYLYMTPVLYAAALTLVLMGLVINGVALYLLYRWQV